MKSPIEIRSLQESDIPEMHRAFVRAFSDYPLSFNMDKEQFIRKFVQRLHINFELSGGAFANNRMVGFIFTATGNYHGMTTAYNGGTGVIPEFRGRQIASSIYQVLIEKFRNENIEQCVLEVLTDNKRALAVYEKSGFRITRFYRCFKCEAGDFNGSTANPLAAVIQQKNANWDLYHNFTSCERSFLDQFDRLPLDFDLEKILEVWFQGQCVGFSVYQPDIGRVSHFAVKEEERRKGMGTALFREMLKNCSTPFLTALNVDDDNIAARNFLQKIGFENKVNQYEMILKLQ